MLKTMHSLVIAFGLMAFLGLPEPVHAGTPEDLKIDSKQALAILVKTNPIAAVMSKKARATLIFPNVVKAGLIFGGAYGEGVLLRAAQFDGYFNSVTVSFGWQAGAQSYGYVVFLMTEKAIQYVRDTNGLEIGVGPTVVMVDQGSAKNLSSSTLKDDAYAFYL